MSFAKWFVSLLILYTSLFHPVVQGKPQAVQKLQKRQAVSDILSSFQDALGKKLEDFTAREKALQSCFLETGHSEYCNPSLTNCISYNCVMRQLRDEL